MIKNIVFDFGGVLMDWDPRYYYQGKFDSDEDMEYFLGNICTNEWNMQQDAGRSLAEATKERIEKFPDFEAHIRNYYGEWEQMLKSDIFENTYLVGRLKELGFPLYGLTNWSAETFHIAKRRYGVFTLFDGIVVSGEEKMVKPDQEIYNVLLKRYQLNANECLFIDDNQKNIQAAQEIGFKTIHLKPEIKLLDELKNLNII